MSSPSISRRALLRGAAAAAATTLLPGTGLLGCRAPQTRAPLTLRPAGARGARDLGWLQARHSFSFGGYQDPAHTHFSDLRVINEDVIAPGRGFPTHPHRDMEILTYLLDGALEHKDSMGNGSVIRPGELQFMSAGAGVTHSEFNPDPRASTHLLQIWLLPARRGGAPRYDQRVFTPADRYDRLALVASPDGAEGSIQIGQDTRLYAGLLHPGRGQRHLVRGGRAAWLQVARGQLRANGVSLGPGDGAGTLGSGVIELEALGEVDLLLFDLRG